MSQSTLNSPIVLALNSNWQAIGHRTVRDAFVAMTGGTGKVVPAVGMDIRYARTDEGWDFSAPIACIPVAWAEWVSLPVREFDLSIQTPRQILRIPTVIIAPNYAKMPTRTPTPCRESIFRRDQGIDQYTREYVPFHEGNLDHVIARDKGGPSTFENLVWTKKSTNSMKGNKHAHEVGLKLIRQPRAPKSVPILATLKPLHRDWHHFLLH